MHDHSCSGKHSYSSANDAFLSFHGYLINLVFRIVFFYLLSRTFASLLARAGLPLPVAQEHLEHDGRLPRLEWMKGIRDHTTKL